MTTGSTARFEIPGYVAVPQGLIRINVTNSTAKTVWFGGGIVAAQVGVTPMTPATFVFGIDNPFTQKVFKIVSESDGRPKVTSTAIVQVNSNGAYAVNSWEVQ